MRCLFENRLSGQGLALDDVVQRIAVDSPEQLPQAFKAIEAAQASGHWIGLVLDYSLGEWLEPALRTDAARGQPTERLVALVARQHRQTVPETRPTATAGHSIKAAINKTAYVKMIDDIQHRIRAGDLYQVNATFPLWVKTDSQPYDLYCRIATRHPSEYAAYIEDGARHLLSFSPELFLRREGQRLVTKPMKGTAPRDLTDPDRDAALGRELLASEKNRAENLMIVDLLRNDMGRLATPGSIRAAPLFELEAYPSVWTLTSTIEATLPKQTGLQAILTALFPCGSVTGAPKIAAMRCIDELEAHPRGVYCGSIGWLAPNGDFALNVAIRTLVLDREGNGAYHVGSGIVHDSIGSEEWDECFWKARTIESNRNT